MNRWALVLAVSLAAVIPDVLTTYYGLETGAFVEGNPHVAQMLSAGYGRWLAWKVVGATAITALCVFCETALPRRYGRWALSPVATWSVAHAAVAVHNTLLIVL